MELDKKNLTDMILGKMWDKVSLDFVFIVLEIWLFNSEVNFLFFVVSCDYLF